MKDLFLVIFYLSIFWGVPGVRIYRWLTIPSLWENNTHHLVNIVFCSGSFLVGVFIIILAIARWLDDDCY